MKSLLVPINSTGNSAGAARYAADLALAIEADVHLLHVIDMGYSFEEKEQHGRDLLNSMRDDLAEPRPSHRNQLPDPRAQHTGLTKHFN